MRSATLAVATLLLFSACSADSDETDAATEEATEVEDTTEAETETETDDAETGESETATDGGASQNVEINLIDELDGLLNGYCLDIAGGNEDIDPANGLQAHTCYSYGGDLGDDQVFDTAEFANNALYMPIQDVCAEAESASAGAAIGLTTCDGNELQTIVFGDDGTLRLASADDLCITAGAESRTGRSSDHQIRDLALAACSDDLASLQQWTFRTGL